MLVCKCTIEVCLFLLFLSVVCLFSMLILIIVEVYLGLFYRLISYLFIVDHLQRLVVNVT